MKTKYKYKQQIMLGFDSEGKRVRQWIYANTKAELTRLREQLREQFKHCAVTPDISFGSYSAIWKSTYKDNKSINTVEMYKNSLKRVEDLCSIPVKDITKTDLQTLINENWEHAETCKKMKMTLKAIFKSAIEDGIISKNPAASLELPKVVQQEKRILTEDEKQSIRELIDISDDRLSLEDKMFLAIEYYFGLRPEETRGLMFSDFTDKATNLTIQRASVFDGNNPILKGTKTEVKRVLPVPVAFMPLLKVYHTAHRTVYLFSDKDSNLMTKSGYRRMWERITKALNLALGGTDKLNVLGKFTAYTLRRTYATTLYYSGISLLKASKLMGHSTQVMLKFYAQIDESNESVELLRKIV